MPTIIVRCNNAYGTHQYPEKVVPLFVSLLSKGKKCTMHGSGKQTRSFIHVYDVCRALDLIWKKGELGEIYLIGSEDEISIVDLARKIAKCIESTKDLKEEDFIAYGEDRCSNDKHYHIDDKELRSLGFKQKIPFDEGLKDVVKWYLENPDYWESSRKESSS